MTRKRDEILDHEADGIREFDNDLPRWWLYGFYFTVIFGAAYLVNYHVLPAPLVGPTSIQAEYEADVAAAAPTRPAAPEATASTGGDRGPGGAPVTLLTDAASLERGREIYESSTHPCAACHRPDLGGLVGPNLTDDGWLHGCEVTDVANAIRVGFPLQGMLPYGGGSPLTDEQVAQLASYILSRRGSNPPDARPADPARDKVCS